MKANLKTWPATPVEASLKSMTDFVLETLPKLLFQQKREQPGPAGHPMYYQG